MKKAQVGLKILLGVITSIFVIGLLVTIFALMSSNIVDTDSLYTEISGTITNETLTTVENVTGENFSVSSYRSAICTLTDVRNTTNAYPINSGNYTSSNCNLKSTSLGSFYNFNWNVSYTYTALARTDSIDIINDTIVATAGVTDWFTIMIVITAMVVLILLTVIIITAIRGSGLMGKGGKGKGGGNIGTA